MSGCDIPVGRGGGCWMCVGGECVGSLEQGLEEWGGVMSGFFV